VWLTAHVVLGTIYIIYSFSRVSLKKGYVRVITIFRSTSLVSVAYVSNVFDFANVSHRVLLLADSTGILLGFCDLINDAVRVSDSIASNDIMM
jgi:hypothetical protein